MILLVTHLAHCHRHGEGGSGGALGIAVGDRVLMQDTRIYIVKKSPPLNACAGHVCEMWEGPGGRQDSACENPAKKVEAAGGRLKINRALIADAASSMTSCLRADLGRAYLSCGRRPDYDSVAREFARARVDLPTL